MATRSSNLRRILFGDPLATSQAPHQRISKLKALAVFSSDPLSSVAYATEEILFILVLAGSTGTALTLPIAGAIALLLLIVATSYYQTIHAYPNGGGAYIVSKDNLGELAGLVAGSALMIDYILTVAVSVAAGIGAIYSAVPALYPYRTLLGIFAIAIVMVINLRGIRESATIFSVPTYLFIASIFALVGIGLFRLATGTLAPVEVTHEVEGFGLQSITLFLVLRAFSAGCTALTGVEAISNGIPAFRPPESDNAGKTLIAMIVISTTMFLGITLLAVQIRAVPVESETVLSQIGRAVFGPGVGYVGVQIATALILLLAANTSFADFPRLASLIAKDGYLPRQLANLGDRLVFSNGIVVLAAASSFLLLIFGGQTHRLLPLYALGVFMCFTLSQSGMVLHWRRLRAKGWKHLLAINAVGAVATGVVLVVITVTRFSRGAWLVIVFIPIIVWGFYSVKNHYVRVAERLSLDRFGAPSTIRRHRVILPIGGVHRGVVYALNYARSLSPDVTAILVDVNPEATERIRQKWEQWGEGVRLEVLPSPYRSVIAPIHDYLEKLEADRQPQDLTTVVIPQFIPAHWWENLLHNQTALLLRLSLIFRRGMVVTDVPYQLKSNGNNA